MAWSTPMTAVASTGLTAAPQWNASVRDNLLETGPGKAIGGDRPQHWVVSDDNEISAREVDYESVNASESTASTSFTALATAGAEVTVTTGEWALIFIDSRVGNSSTSTSYAGYAISGASSSSASTDRSVENKGTDDIQAGRTDLIAVTAGSNTFTMQYRVSANTGTFGARRIGVMAF